MTDAIDVSRIHYAKDTETIMFMVSAGFGVSFLPEYTLSAVRDYHLKAIPIEGVNLTADIIAAWVIRLKVLKPQRRSPISSCSRRWRVG